MAIDLTLSEFVQVYPEFRETTAAMFAHARAVAEAEVTEAMFGQVKGKIALIELIAEQLGPVPGPNETTPRVGGVSAGPHRVNFERIRATLGPFVDLV